MSIENLSLTELKALAYDNIAIVEQAQNNLKLINERIAQLANAEAQAKQDKKEGGE